MQKVTKKAAGVYRVTACDGVEFTVVKASEGWKVYEGNDCGGPEAVWCDTFDTKREALQWIN